MVNKINDNFDYFYIKHADASRVYGLELEDLLAPNRMRFLINAETLIEEHVVGIPGEQFIRTRLEDLDLNKIRLTKEFVKFNERCFVRLLGDMHSSNFVIDITPDFEEISYRLRAIDFDQQSYEGRKSIYLPKYFKENNPIINLGFGLMTPETVQQYQREERSLMANRVKSSQGQINELIAGTKDQQELRAVARLLIKYFHPKLIKELLQQFGLDIPTNLMQKIINSKSMLSDDHNSDSQDKHELMELSTLVQSHINDISIGLHFDLKEALAQDFREAFANKISRSFAHSLFAELNITETMPTRISLKPELKLLSDCFYKQRLTPLIERNIVLLRKELDNQIYKASTKPFERDLYAHALKSMVA